MLIQLPNGSWVDAARVASVEHAENDTTLVVFSCGRVNKQFVLKGDVRDVVAKRVNSALEVKAP